MRRAWARGGWSSSSATSRSRYDRCGLALICAPACQGVAGVERIAARDHHDRNPVCLLGRRRHLAVEDAIALGEGQAEVAVGAPDMDRHQAPPAIRRRRARRSITAAVARISALMLANC